MKWKIENVLENKWEQEIAVLGFAFTLFSIKNDWILFRSFQAVLPGIVYFFILYFHAQCNRFFLLPILFKKHKPLIYLAFTAILAFFFSVALYEIANNYLYQTSALAKFSHQKSYPYQLASVVGTLICVLGPTTLLKFYSEQKKQSSETILLNQMQLNSLRSQLNPHFLFNTFNTLYGISLEYPERTPDLIMKVSQLMRYQLESTDRQCVTIEEELSFIDSYIQLEKERVGYRCEILYDCKIDNENAYKISPMLLIGFVENAFKHGAGTIESCYVRIKITVEKGKLHLNIVNSIPEKKREIISTKIGLKNTKERLELLYPGTYNLDLHETGNTYTVDLRLQLKKIVQC
ncbi:sensor histidine kinase [Flavobacterium noncentrifugens]|uniref:Histidine kinase n=1 Tax=Flavobacterium noncentrifugens TaxID=1128970 RepID=A0A1G8TB97_9FLAO|nr:histidine kinase [Flavobacterium noncentrifugens]GEP50157.1 sensor histidine kinase [Flavobacterium noncentrifugens]SDJ38761.1 Histidine kinase [Flavobacterium noncentrifugens]